MALQATASLEGIATAPAGGESHPHWRRVVGRRSFRRGIGLAGAATLPGGALLTDSAFASTARLSDRDVATLRLLAAIELIESDLWQQYNELGGACGANAAYMTALSNLDGDMPQYIAEDTDDELSHAAFQNAYVRSKGARRVDLDEFSTLPSSKATGARQVGRLTSLERLNVGTSWYVGVGPGRHHPSSAARARGGDHGLVISSRISGWRVTDSMTPLKIIPIPTPAPTAPRPPPRAIASERNPDCPAFVRDAAAMVRLTTWIIGRFLHELGRGADVEGAIAPNGSRVGDLAAVPPPARAGRGTRRLWVAGAPAERLCELRPQSACSR
jgi:hypothetical protein